SSVFVPRPATHRDLHSFPTRRSSDLKQAATPASIVLTTTKLIRRSVPERVEPGLKPNQPNARTNVPPMTIGRSCPGIAWFGFNPDRKSTRLNSSHDQISYAVFCLKKK